MKLIVVFILIICCAKAMEQQEISLNYVASLKALCIHSYLNHRHAKVISDHQIEKLSLPDEIKDILRAYKQFEHTTLQDQIPVFIELNDSKYIDAALHFMVHKQITRKDYIKKFANDFFHKPPSPLAIELKYYDDLPIPLEDWKKYEGYIETEKENYLQKRKKISQRASICCAIWTSFCCCGVVGTGLFAVMR